MRSRRCREARGQATGIRVRNRPRTLVLETLEARLLLAGGLYLQHSLPLGDTGSPFDRLELQFSQPVRDGSFDLGDVRLDGPGGVIHPTALNRLADDRYELIATGQTGLDSYWLTIGPDVLAESTGQQMDQNHDGTPGGVDDAYTAALFANGATIADGDETYDDKSVVVWGNVVTVAGAHVFDMFDVYGGATIAATGDALDTYSLYVDGASMLNIVGGATVAVAGDLSVTGNSTLLCQGKSTTGQVDGQWAGQGVSIVAGSVRVDAGSVITADGQGYVAGAGPGAGGGGGSHGGRGSHHGGPTYGLSNAPVDLGSGGEPFGGTWNRGGGAVRIDVSGTFTLDGEITADGLRGGTHARGAAGGSIYVTTTTLAGSGKFTADGSPGTYGNAGGGRVAVYYGADGGFSGFAGSTAAAGGGDAEPGTIGFFDTSVVNTRLHVYQRFVFQQDSTDRLGALTAHGSAVVQIGGGATLTIDGAFAVEGNSTILCQGKNTTSQVDGQWAGQGVSIVAGSVRIDAGSMITADGQGYTAGVGPGAGGGGGSHGGRGSHNGGPTYGVAIAPLELGSGGEYFSGTWNRGGGAIRINVSGQFTLDGEITADGQNGGTHARGAAGGSIYVTTTTLTGSGRFTADGSPGAYGNAGGGRVAVYFGTDGGFSGFTGSTAAAGGGDAEPGTIGFFDTSIAGNYLHVYQTFAFEQDWSDVLGGMAIDNGATVRIDGGAAVNVDGEFVVTGDSTVNVGSKNRTAMVDGRWRGEGATINVGSMTVDVGSLITADGQGYVAGAGPGAGSGGGSHGGQGSHNGGPTYGLAEAPMDLGSGGQHFGGTWNSGGGAIRINVSGTFALDGEITTDGQNGGTFARGAAGGSVLLNVATLSGSGTITADGSPGTWGHGGGGRVAVHYRDAISLPWTQITAAPGGAGAEPGSVVISDSPYFFWREPTDELLHGTETLSWDAVGVDFKRTTVDVSAFGSEITIAADRPMTETMDWDTAAAAQDGAYELRAVYRDLSAEVVGETSLNVRINNAAAWHSGLIAADETWQAGQVHIVEHDVDIASGVQVTVEPGTIVKFAGGTRITLEDGALLEAPATVALPIVFTSLADDEVGGDTNVDGSQSVPQPGDWRGFVVQGTGQLDLSQYVDLRYMQLIHSGTIDTDETWSGTFVHLISGDLTVSSGVRLEIEPGAVVKIDLGVQLTVQAGGQLVADGTVAQPIVFTSVRDDSFGGDTNRDGNQTSPLPGDWHSIHIDGGQASFDHARLRYGAGTSSVGAALVRTSGAAHLTIANSLLEEALYTGVLAWGGTTVVSNSVLVATDRGLSAHPGSTVDVINCTVDDNRLGLLVHGGTLNVANTIVSNSLDAGISFDVGTLQSVVYSNVWARAGSGSQNYRGTADLTGTGGNVSVDPEYKDAGRGNYRLGYVSPMIDAADGSVAPATDSMGAPRYDDPRTANTGLPDANGDYPDLGAYEFGETADSNLDLIVVSVVGPADAIAGDTAALQWTVRNVGDGNVHGPWHDTVYLVRNPDTNPVPVEAAEVLVGQGVVLGPGTSYTATADIPVPGSIVADHRWQVTANTKGEIFEGRNKNNNTGVSNARVRVDVPELVVDAPATLTQFPEDGKSTWFKFIPEAGQDILVSLDASTESGATELYIARGYMPTTQHYDVCQTEWNSVDVTALVSQASTQTYYVLAFARSLPAGISFQIDARAPTFSISSVDQPGLLWTGYTATLTIHGGQLEEDMIYELVSDSGGYSNPATDVFFVNSSLVYATFNDVQDRLWVQARKGAATARSDYPVRAQLPSGTNHQVQFSISYPKAVRPDWTVPITIHYRNGTGGDVLAPLMMFTVDNATASYLTPRSPNANPIERTTYERVFETGYMLGINRNGPAGVLPPGAAGIIQYELQPGIANGDIRVTLHTYKNPGQPAEWDALKDELRPFFVREDAWDPIFTNFTNSVGSTVGELNAVLAENATYLSGLGEYLYDGNRLIVFELEQSGLSDITRRYALEAFGRGRGLVWDIWGEKRGDSQAVIHYADGTVRSFWRSVPVESNPIVKYTGGAGDHGELLYKSGIGWTLKEPDGTELRFQSDPADQDRFVLDYVEDLNDNRTTLNYTGDRVTGVADSTGNSVTYAYDGNGRIIQVTDSVGRIATYSYDLSGEHLVSVTGPAGDYGFTYVTGQGAAREHAVQSITYPCGTHTFYEYDDRGRLSRRHAEGGAEELNYAYDSTGGVTVTNSESAGTKTSYGRFWDVAQITGPLGTTARLSYDNQGNLLSRTAPGETRAFGTFDAHGRLTAAMDPAGHEVTVGYGQHGRITSLTNPRGITSQYRYDEYFNPNEIAYPDGSAEQFSHDTWGNITQWVNRRGDRISYTYDTDNLLTRKEHGDGSHTDYTYDAHHNLLTATDVTGTTSFAYDAADRLTRITYPNGRFLAYAHDAGGRRVQMVDQDGFATNYDYDAIGHLSGLTDGTGAPIITYEYDDVGRLARANMGNGTYTTYEYDAASELIHLANRAPDDSVLGRFDYAYDDLGRMVKLTTLEGVTDYQYDASGQLTSVSLPTGRTIDYRYDPSGNRRSVTDDGVQTDYATNSMDQYTSSGTAIFGYDTDGNLISKTKGGATWIYNYDDENRLIAMTTPDGTWTYDYDVLGNRVASTHDGQRTEYLVDPFGMGNVVGEYDSGSLVANYVHGLGLASRVDSANAAAYYGFDGAANTVQVTDATGAVLNSYSYLPFGEQLTSIEGIANPFTYVGQFGVAGGDDDLYFMRNRSYDPASGRFIQHDPIGLAGGGPNLYRYAANAPNGFVDPAGLWTWQVGICYSYGAGAGYSGAIGVVVGGEDYLSPVPDIYATHGVGGHGGANVSIGICTAVTNAQNPGHLAGVGGYVGGSGGEVFTVGGNLVGGGGGDNDVYAGVEGNVSVGIGTPVEVHGGANYTVVVDPVHTLADMLMVAYEFWFPDPQHQDISVVSATDPNDVLGPAGYGPDHYVAGGTALPYTVRCENDPNATAPAQVVEITQQLDVDLDWSTFQLTGYGFGDYSSTIPGGLQSFSQRVDKRNDTGLYVDFSVSFDADTGLITWKFQSIDPVTHEVTMDPYAGFLPPNQDPPQGDAYVSYMVEPLTDLPTGTEVTAQATIVFDTNDPIDTNEHLNTIDAVVPASQVNHLPAQSGPSIHVTWDGQDEPGGSGVESHDVYVSTDGGPFALWLAGTTNTTAVLSGQVGHAYAFYSVATDRVGHREFGPVEPDAETKVVANPWHNESLAWDASGDQRVVPLDVLLIINEINLHGARQLTNNPTPPHVPPPYVDVNNDLWVTPLDVLIIINYLNSNGTGEGEAGRVVARASRAPTQAWPISSPFCLPLSTGAERASEAVYKQADLPRSARPDRRELDWAARIGDGEEFHTAHAHRAQWLVRPPRSTHLSLLETADESLEEILPDIAVDITRARCRMDP